MLEDHSLVLGGGGVAGIAWMTGRESWAGREQGRAGLAGDG